MTKKKDINIEIGELETPKSKIKERSKTIDIQVNGLQISIPLDLEYVTEARQILEVFENKLSNSGQILQNPKIIRQDDEDKEAEEEKPIIEEQKEVEIKPMQESYTNCPICNGKLKRKKIIKDGDKYRQKVKCKSWKCNFERDYVFSL